MTTEQERAIALAQAMLKIAQADPQAEAAKRVQAAKSGTLRASPESLARAAEADQIAEDQMTLSDVPPVVAGAMKVTQGLPLAGQWVDEGFDALGADGGKMRRINDAMDRQHPWVSTALQITGGVAGSLPAIALGAPAAIANAPRSLAALTTLAGVTGGVVGAVDGASSGAGRAEPGNRIEGAKDGALVGGVMGAAAGIAAPLVSAGVKAIAERVKGLDVAAIAKTFGISKEAASVLKTDLDALDFPSAERNLTAAGPEAMLADAGQPTREALDAAITGGGKAARIGTDAVSARAAAAGAKLDRVMDLMLGVPKGIKAAAKDIATRTAPMRKKAYDMAYNTAIDYADPKGRAVEDVLKRIPTSTLRAAIAEADDAMRAAGVTNMQVMKSIQPDGSVVTTNPPNVQQLDELKKALGAILQKETDPVTGKVTQAGIRARELARQLKAAVADAVPAYGRAVKLGGDKIEEDAALAIGRNLFASNTTRETVVDTMRGASVEAQAAARQGVREYIDNTLARVRRGFDDPNVDTRETLRLLNELSSRDSREKLTAILGQAKADRLLKEVDEVGRQFGTRQAIATGSDSGRRIARGKAIDDAIAPGIIGTAAQGAPVKSVQAFIQLLTRETPQAQLARKQEVLAEVAKALTQKRGPEAVAALKLVEKALSGQPLKSQEAVFLGRVVGTTGALAGYQSGQQYLTSPSGAR